MLAEAAALRDGRRAAMHGRATRRLQRAQRLRTRHEDEALRLRAEIDRLGSTR